MRVIVLASALALALAAGCSSAPRSDAGRVVRPDADMGPVGSCLSPGECAEFREYTLEGLGMFEASCMGTWTMEVCDERRDLPNRIAGGCRTNDPGGPGYTIQWLFEPAYDARSAEDLCELAGLPFEPAP